MPKVEELEEKIKLSRQLINDALDRSSILKIPENKLVELIQVNGFFNLALRKESGELTSEEVQRIEGMIKRMEEVLVSIEETK